MSELVPAGPRRPNPARVYLAGLAPGGRPAVAYQLRQVAAILTGQADLDAVPWARLTRPVVIGILETLRQRGLAIATVNHCLSVLKRVAEEAWADGQMDVETYTAISKVRRRRGTSLAAGRAPGRDEVRAAIEAALAGPTRRHLRDAALIATLAGAGLRASELLTLATDDYVAGRLRVLGKGHQAAWQPLAPAARVILDAYLEDLPPGPLFRRWHRYDVPSTQPLSAAGLRHVLRTWLPDLSPHDLRRGYATWLDQDGQSLSVVQRLMRHANPATTMRYIRNAEDAQAAADTLRF